MAKKNQEELDFPQNIGRVQDRQITEEMSVSYLDYAMSVIVSRALPDVRDGLKPVQRRILYSMHELGLRASAKFRKSATVVGDVLGKYHPHGDISVYDAMVRMAQDFGYRYPLVNGQGNFGSMDGDAPAAMRYTEAKMSSITEEVLSDIDKETVNWLDNYDATRKEPHVMPARLPSLLLNGTVGIAVGMATSIPPHNLGEVSDAITHVIENPDATVEDLLNFVKGPDFPTGGIIYDWNAIKQAYATGKGGIVMRAKAEITEAKNGDFVIVITEIPYQVNKAALLTKIADLVRDKKVEGIRDLRDESDKDGVRVVIELKRDALPQKVLNQLYKHTQLQETFHLNMLALTEGGIVPRILNLKGLIEEYIKHREEVVTRRTQYDLTKAKERAHILEGLKKALDHIDQIIATIKKSETKEVAHKALQSKFKLSAIQSQAILDMKLSTLSGLERKKIEDELKEKKKLIEELESILKSKKKIRTIVKTEVVEMRKKFADDRRTQLRKEPIGEMKDTDLIQDEEVIITITKGGYVKRLASKTYRSQTRGGKGVIGVTPKEEDVVEHLVVTNTLDEIMFFTNTGRAFQAKVYELPESSRTAKGQALVNFLQLRQGEQVTGLIAFSAKDKKNFLVMTTRQGVIKKVQMDQFMKVRRSGLIAITLKGGDQLAWVRLTSGADSISLVTAQGQSIRFHEKDVRAMGRNAAGVTGIKLHKDDMIVGMDVISKEFEARAQLLIVSEKGMAKRTPIKEYKLQHRGGSGVKTLNVTPKTGKVRVATVTDAETDKDADVLIVSSKGQVIRLPLKTISLLGRVTQGVRAMKLEDGDSVASATVI